MEYLIGQEIEVGVEDGSIYLTIDKKGYTEDDLVELFKDEGVKYVREVDEQNEVGQELVKGSYLSGHLLGA